MNEEDTFLLNEIVLTRNLCERTKELYSFSMKRYSEFCGKSITELLEEAEDEEDNHTPWKKTKLRKRLLSYRVYLYDKYLPSTAKNEFSRIQTIYRHFEISFQKLPPLSGKQFQKSEIKFKDLLTKEIIQDALKVSDKIMEPIILFQLSSGCTAIETLNLKIINLIDAVEDYYPAKNIYDVIDNLADRNDIVPMFHLKRPKTGKEFYTFCTPEAFKSICAYLKTRKNLNDNDKLFKICQVHLMNKFREINNILELGRFESNNYVRFRSHMLRKFHASTLYNNGMSMEVVNDLQGKSKNKVDSCYFFDDPYKLKEKYIAHMDCLCINTEMTHLDIKSKEYILLENELERKNKEFDNLKDKVLNIEAAINCSMSKEELDIIDKYV